MTTVYKSRDIKNYLKKLNLEYSILHKRYEEYFWKSYMGEPRYDEKMNTAMVKRDAFKSNPVHLKEIRKRLPDTTGELKEKMTIWKKFFLLHKIPAEALEIRKQIGVLENEIAKKLNNRTEGYKNPKTKKFVEMSNIQMRTAMSVESNEKLRKAYFKGIESTATFALDEYIKLIGLRNDYAHTLGYDDFYDYKVQHEDAMTKDELFNLFDEIYDQTKYAHKDIRKLEKKQKGLRAPWNFGYMMAGDLTKEEEPYFPLKRALDYWGRAFHGMGVGLGNGNVQMDLINRKGKYPNGFCHWPDLVSYKGPRRIAGSANFTCNAIIDQTGSGNIAMNTLFHEGGHAAHFLNIEQSEVCLNHESLPMTSAWAETQSMFMDTTFKSPEWRTRYAKNDDGKLYPFSLYKKAVKKTGVLRPTYLMSIHAVMSFERDVYETKKLTKEKVLKLAKKNFKKFFDRSEDSLWLLNIPHIYSFDSSAGYHGYGLAKIAVMQWQAYFYTKYGHIIDNKNIGKEMKEVWKDAAKYTFAQFVKKATGKKLSTEDYIAAVTKNDDEVIATATERIDRLSEIKKNNQPVKLKARITMVHGHRKIANNMVSFEDMTIRYAKWINMQRKKQRD